MSFATGTVWFSRLALVLGKPSSVVRVEQEAKTAAAAI